jgi:hypothetical protein
MLALSWLVTRARMRLALVLSAIALVAIGVGTVKALDPDRQRPDGRAAARFIDANAPPNASVWNLGGLTQSTAVYLRRPHLMVGEFPPSAWGAAARARSPVFTTFLGAKGYLFLIRPPGRYAKLFRLAAEYNAPGTPLPITTREWSPRP